MKERAIRASGERWPTARRATIAAFATCLGCSDSTAVRSNRDAGARTLDAAAPVSAHHDAIAPNHSSDGARPDHVADGAPPKKTIDAAAEDPDPDPVLTAHDRELLLALSPDVLPKPPPDPTNRFADDLDAAALGARFFVDPSFSGKLLSTDHDGSKGSLGHPGDTGKSLAPAAT